MNTHRAHRLVVAWWFFFFCLFVLIARIISTSSASGAFMPTYYKHWLHCVILHLSFFLFPFFALSCTSTTCQQQLINRPFPSAACLLYSLMLPCIRQPNIKKKKKKSLKIRSVRTPRFVASWLQLFVLQHLVLTLIEEWDSKAHLTDRVVVRRRICLYLSRHCQFSELAKA